MKYWVSALFALLAMNLQAQCPDTLLVSAYFSGNVHLYDACTGEFQGLLDSAGRLAGAQASQVGPDGMLYVVAENRNSIVRYDAQTLAYVDTPITLPLGFGATGIAFRGDEIWIASYSLSLVRRFDRVTGQALGDVISAMAAGLRGADNGMTFGPDGRLYVPGFDSNSVVRHDPATGATSGFIESGAGGLFRTRGILFEPGGETVLVSSEGNGKILRFAVSDGRFLSEVVANLRQPTGMAFHSDGSLLVAHASGVARIDPSSGAILGGLASATAGGAQGPTFLTVLPRGTVTAIDTSQIGSQYWLAGAGPMQGKVIEIANLVSTVGSAFGAAFDPEQVVRKRWGAARIVFTSCTEGEFSWNSTGPESAGFGTGGYPVRRLLSAEPTQRCLDQGFHAVDDHDWIVGSWYGGPARDGEGLMLDMNSEGIVFLTWFTYRPH